MTKVAMMSPTWLRPSNLPRLAKCPASGIESEGLPQVVNDKTVLGTAAHALLSFVIEKRAEGWEQECAALATRFHVPVDALRRFGEEFVAFAASIPADCEVGCELPMEIIFHDANLPDGQNTITILGTADLALWYPAQKCVDVLDLKTGDPEYADPLAMLQVQAYALAAARSRGAERARATLWYAAYGGEGFWNLEMNDKAAMQTAAMEVLRIAKEALMQANKPQAERSYRTGDHCTFCPARGGCPAYAADLGNALRVLDFDTTLLTMDNVAQVHERAKTIDRMAFAVKNAVKAFVRTHGPVPLEDGRELRIVPIHKPSYTVREHDEEHLRAVKREDA